MEKNQQPSIALSLRACLKLLMEILQNEKQYGEVGCRNGRGFSLTSLTAWRPPVCCHFSKILPRWQRKPFLLAPATTCFIPASLLSLLCLPLAFWSTRRNNKCREWNGAVASHSALGQFLRRVPKKEAGIVSPCFCVGKGLWKLLPGQSAASWASRLCPLASACLPLPVLPADAPRVQHGQGSGSESPFTLLL